MAGQAAASAFAAEKDRFRAGLTLVFVHLLSEAHLDRLNAEGKAWREHNKPAQDQTLEQPASDAIQTTQLDLWEKR